MTNALDDYLDLVAFVREQMAGEDFWGWYHSLDEDSAEQVLGVMSDPSIGLYPHQQMPRTGELSPGGMPWRIWFIRAGRAAGKSYGCGCNVNLITKYLYPGLEGIIVGPTVKHVRETMVDALKKSAPADHIPSFSASTSTVRWPNGSKAVIYTAENPEAIRGPTVYWGWGDELTLWSEQTFDNMMRAVRNKHPEGNRVLLGTSPIAAQKWVKAIESRPSTITTVARTMDNPQGNDPQYIAEMAAEAAKGSRKAQEEVLGLWVDGDAKLWTLQDLQHISIPPKTNLKEFAAQMDQRLLSIDPGGKRDLTGLILLGRKDDMYWVLGDWSTLGTKNVWEAQVARIAEDFMLPGDRVIVETNAHNDADVDLRKLLPGFYVEGKHQPPGQGKTVRAERAHQLYEKDSVRHFGHFTELNQQMDEFYEIVAAKHKSPDRVDALAMGLNWFLDQRANQYAVWQTPIGVRFNY